MENMSSQKKETEEKRKFLKKNRYISMKKKKKEKTSYHQLMYVGFLHSVFVQKQVVFYSNTNTHFTL
jgi:hypothetical protein